MWRVFLTPHPIRGIGEGQNDCSEGHGVGVDHPAGGCGQAPASEAGVRDRLTRVRIAEPRLCQLGLDLRAGPALDFRG
jgi:hypothetical protein